jgi:hypothetical protein
MPDLIRCRDDEWFYTEIRIKVEFIPETSVVFATNKESYSRTFEGIATEYLKILCVKQCPLEVTHQGIN